MNEETDWKNNDRRAPRQVGISASVTVPSDPAPLMLVLVMF